MLTRVLLFGSSYIPLYVIFLVRFNSFQWLWIALIVLFGAPLVVLFIVVAKRKAPQMYEVASVRDSGTGVAAYVGAYVLPFVTVNEPAWRDLAGYAILFLVLGLVSIRSELLGLNPLVYFTPWRLCEIHTSAGASFVLTTKTTPQTGQVVVASRVGATPFLFESELS